jgi:hypothetical protein
MRTLLLAGVACAAAMAADNTEARKEEMRECVQCHSLRIVHSQRLPAAAWGREIDKMVGWGATVQNRQLLLDYLASEYSDAKPVPEAEKSADGRKAK